MVGETEAVRQLRLKAVSFHPTSLGFPLHLTNEMFHQFQTHQHGGIPCSPEQIKEECLLNVGRYLYHIK
jgi:hypothetical protein